MLFYFLFLATYCTLLIHGFSYSVLMNANEPKNCFYLRVNEADTPLHIYYSISEAKLKDKEGTLLDFHLTGIRGEIIQSVPSKATSELTIDAREPGEYAACFYHKEPSRKIINVDFTEGRSAQAKAAAAKSPTAALEESNEKLSNNLEDLLQSFRYLKNRERRNMETVEETHTRIVFMSILEVILILGMSLLQVVIMRTLFSPSRRPRV